MLNWKAGARENRIRPIDSFRCVRAEEKGLKCYISALALYIIIPFDKIKNNVAAVICIVIFVLELGALSVRTSVDHL